MPVKYVTAKTTPLFSGTTGQGRVENIVLIFGDELNVDDAPITGRLSTNFRGRPGYVNEKDMGNKPALEMYFIDVGQGDSTFIVTPNRKKILIDGGINNRAYGFIAWKYGLAETYNRIDIDLLVLSHGDDDHIKGLVSIIKHPKIKVNKIIHNGIINLGNKDLGTTIGKRDTAGKYLLTRHDGIASLIGAPLADSFREWYEAIETEGVIYSSVDASTSIIDIGDPDVKIEVLGPSLDTLDGLPAYRWFGSEAETRNGHSVVLKLTYGKTSFIFPGDLNGKGQKHLMDKQQIASRIPSDVLKAPHHGSHDFYALFLKTLSPRITVISSGDEPDYGHPRAIFLGTIGQLSRSTEPLVFSIKLAANFIEKIDKGKLPASAKLEKLEVKSSADKNAKILFKRRLHGMINVRSDGESLYAARRLIGASPWESYGPIAQG